MKLYFVITAAFLLSITPLYAQDTANSITIIREDGSQESIDIGGGGPDAKAQEPEIVKEPSQPFSPPQKVESAIFKQEESQPAPVESPAEDIAQPAVEEAEPMPEPSATVETEAQQEPEPSPQARVAKPRRKPAGALQTTAAQPVPQEPQTPQNNNATGNGAPISQSVALSIAIDEAPPADDFQVFKNYQGDIPIYQVLFRTGQDFYEVQIDAFEGIILYSGYRDDLDSFSPRAGHLPRKLSP